MHIGIISNLLQQNTINNNKSLTNSLEKLSTGLRINKASNDASGLAISDKLRTQASGIKQGIENANSAIALTQIADKSMGEISNILDTVKAKLIQAHSNTTSEDGRVAIKKDIEKLLTQIENISTQTNYNGVTLLSHEGLEFQVGDKSSDIIPLKRININLDSLSGVGNSGIDYSKIDLADLQSGGYYIYHDNFDAGEVIFTKNDMLKTNYGYSSLTNNIKDIVTNNIEIFSSLISPIHFEMEVNSSNFQKTTFIDSVNTYSKFQLQISEAYIIPEDDNTREYFERYLINAHKGNATYIKDGNNGDLGFGYFQFAWASEFWFLSDEQFENDEFLRTNQILKFTVAQQEHTSGRFRFYVAENIQINNITANGFTDIDFGHSFYINPNDIHPNSPTIACGTLTDLKNMPHSSFTFDCAGGFQGVVDYALDVLNDYRGEVGSTQNQLESSVRNSMTSYVNLKNAESIIRDVDYAQESANFNKSNIIAQAGSFVLSQASQVEKNWVAQLLK